MNRSGVSLIERWSVFRAPNRVVDMTNLSTPASEVFKAVRFLEEKASTRFVLFIHVDKDCKYADETIIQAVRARRSAALMDKEWLFEVERDADNDDPNAEDPPVFLILRCPACQTALLDGSQCDCSKYD